MLLFALLSVANARTLAGVTMPDAATVGGQSVPLNGLGLREKYFLDIYVGGLYLSHPTHDGGAAIKADEPKRIVMHFIYSKVTKEQMIETFEEGFKNDPNVNAQRANIAKIEAAVPAEVHSGEEIAFDYVPGAGTTMYVKGKSVVTVAGADFMRMLFGIYLGPNPPTADLKSGLLGG